MPKRGGGGYGLGGCIDAPKPPRAQDLETAETVKAVNGLGGRVAMPVCLGCLLSSQTRHNRQTLYPLPGSAAQYMHEIGATCPLDDFP